MRILYLYRILLFVKYKKSTIRLLFEAFRVLYMSLLSYFKLLTSLVSALLI